MRWLARKQPDLTQWHRWFAWHPVKTHSGWGNAHWIWLEPVERQVVYAAGGAAPIYRLASPTDRRG